MRSGKIKRQTQARIVSADRQENMQLLKKPAIKLSRSGAGLLCLIYQCVTELASEVRPALSAGYTYQAAIWDRGSRDSSLRIRQKSFEPQNRLLKIEPRYTGHS